MKESQKKGFGKVVSLDGSEDNSERYKIHEINYPTDRVMIIKQRNKKEQLFYNSRLKK